MEYSCLAWVNDQITLGQLHVIQKKALKIIEVDEDLALQRPISKLSLRRTIAATAVL